MNINMLRKSINVCYLDYYGQYTSVEFVDRVINYYKQLTRENRIESDKKNRKK